MNEGRYLLTHIPGLLSDGEILTEIMDCGSEQIFEGSIFRCILFVAAG